MDIPVATRYTMRKIKKAIVAENLCIDRESIKENMVDEE
jgi:hypothetical protein